MAGKIAILEGWQMPRRRRRRFAGAQQTRMGRAARACKGKRRGAFRACIRAHMKKRSHLSGYRRRRRRH